MNAQPTVGFAHFLSQTDAVGTTILFLLLVMSVATWYLIATKALSALLMRQRTRRFLGVFWNSPSLQSVAKQLDQTPADEPFSNLAQQAILAARHHQRHGANTLNESGSTAEFLTRAIRRVIDEETARFESGLTVLASIGSTAPFLGLFGTVWGVYHALVAIGMSGQGTLDKVAGPVGEALIMTALGLAVAIPAVLAYNFAVRRNRLVLAQLDSFAHDLFSFLTTGSHVSDAGESIAPLHAPAVQGAR
ncbi:MAG: MotA/TolQ/ExbB proton channel [Betaproteobacteria bacterium]|nr:MotA/TolQ/ExbB proton channel [Betaproteobacteria bacterium]